LSDTIVILGGGPAGLACAYKILKSSDYKVVVLDKAPFVGGAGASFQWKGHTLDFGPHAFHARGDEAEDLMRTLFQDDPSVLIEGQKRVRVFLKGRRFRYPLQVGEALLKFNPLLSIRIIVEFALTSIFHAIVSIPVDNFENWGRKRFGSTLYRLSFGDYTEKVWKTAPDRISERFASEKIQGFSFVNLVKRLFRLGGQVTEPYYQKWIYHKKGSGQLYSTMADVIRQMGGEILLGCQIRGIETSGNAAEAVRVVADDGERVIGCHRVVSSIGLAQLISLLPPPVPFSVRHSASKLSYTSLVLVYVEFAQERIGEDHWFYLLEPRYRFNRVTEQKNLSAETMEPGKTVLVFELTCHLGDDLWRASDEEAYQMVVDDCKSIDFLPFDNVSDFMVKRVPNVYEIYYKDFDQHAELALSYVREFRNLVSIGRRGLFLQGDMHQAVSMGLEMGAILSQPTVSEDALSEFYSRYVRYLD
jgi:protoporphyrinogen oxidase